MRQVRTDHRTAGAVGDVENPSAMSRLREQARGESVSPPNGPHRGTPEANGARQTSAARVENQMTVEDHIKAVEKLINEFFATNPTPADANKFLTTLGSDFAVMLYAMRERFGNVDGKFSQ
jgi:hypothetical protein